MHQNAAKYTCKCTIELLMNPVVSLLTDFPLKVLRFFDVEHLLQVTNMQQVKNIQQVTF